MKKQSGWPRRPRLGTFRLLGRSRRAHVWRRLVPVVSFDDALVLYAGLTRFGRHGEAAWCGQEDTGRTRAAFRAGGRQLAFRHRSQLCERPALLAHIFVRRHRPPISGQNASCGGPVRRDYRNYTSSQLGCELGDNCVVRLLEELRSREAESSDFVLPLPKFSGTGALDVRQSEIAVFQDLHRAPIC